MLLAITCTKSTTETQIQGVKYVSKPAIMTSDDSFDLTLFFIFKSFHKERKKQSVLTVPKVLRKLNKLKNALKRSRYRHTLSHH